VAADARQECRDVISAMCPGPPTLGTMSAGEESSIAQQHKTGNGVAGGEPAVQVATSTDILFLNSLVNTNTEGSQKEEVAQTRRDRLHCTPITHDSLRLVDQVKTIAEQRIYLDEAHELHELLADKWVQALLEVHDESAAHIQNSLEEVKYIDGVSSNEDSGNEEEDDQDQGEEGEEKSESGEEIVDTFRVIGLRRKAGESLGLTVTTDEGGKVIVARIIIDSFIERQGLLRPGDLILEANGERVRNPEQLQVVIEEGTEFITLKIQPTLSLTQGGIIPGSVEGKTRVVPTKSYVRALFGYDPAKDSLLPCPEIGLPFKYGDILQVVNGCDPSWWQARHEAGDTIGLVPSQDLEERRKCFVDQGSVGGGLRKKFACCGAGKKEKKRFGYTFKKNAEVDAADLQLYEPVERVPPFSRKTLVLVGPPGVGRRALVQRIVAHNPKIFDTIKAVTSRPPSDFEPEGSAFHISREEMEAAVERDEFLEVREQDGHLFGTTYQSIRTVISSSKLCLIDCAPEALKLLHHSPEFLPFVVFLSSPGSTCLRAQAQAQAQASSTSLRSQLTGNHAALNGHNGGPALLSSEEDIRKSLEENARISEEYQKYFDLEVTMEDQEAAFRTIIQSVEKLANEAQWVPLNWVYS